MIKNFFLQTLTKTRRRPFEYIKCYLHEKRCTSRAISSKYKIFRSREIYMQANFMFLIQQGLCKFVLYITLQKQIYKYTNCWVFWTFLSNTKLFEYKIHIGFNSTYWKTARLILIYEGKTLWYILKQRLEVWYLHNFAQKPSNKSSKIFQGFAN